MNADLCPKCQDQPIDGPHGCPFERQLGYDDYTCSCCWSCTDDCEYAASRMDAQLEDRGDERRDERFINEQMFWGA